MRAFELTPVTWLAVDALACARLTRLITRDTITERPREALRHRRNLAWYDLATCPWCAGIWVAAAVTAATAIAPDLWVYPAFGLAVAAVGAIVAERT